MSRQEIDVVIVGNGAIGCALALQLAAQHPDTRVALVGPSGRPRCASLAAGAMLGAFAELDAGALDFPFARRRFDAAREASTMWDAHLELLNARLETVEPVRINRGTYVVANAAASTLDERNLEAISRYLSDHHEPFHEVDPRTIAGTRTAERARQSRAIYIENEGAVSARHLHRAYDEAFSRTPGVTIVDAEVASIDAGGATKIVRTSAGQALGARHVVIAAGAHTQVLVEQLGLEARVPRIAFGIGVSVILRSQDETPKKVFRSPNRGLACGVYVVPYEDGYCYVGATSHISSTAIPLPRVRAVHDLLGAAMEQVNTAFGAAEIHKTIVGYRPTTMDTFPLLGQTSIDGVWIASGTKRDGFHLSPKIADELVRAMDTGSQPFEGAFAPERSLILEVPRRLAVDRAVQLVVAAERNGLGTQPANQPPVTEAAARERVLDAYERCGLKNEELGIPPELLEMYREGYAAANLDQVRRD